MAIPLFVSRLPDACNAFVAILGGVSVLLYWSALRPYFGMAGATLAAALMACMPWSELYGDRIWNPNVLVFFVALAFWAACRLRRDPSLGAVVLLFVSSAAMPQLHMSSPMVWLALVPLFLPSVRKWRWYWPLVALACAAVLYVPMFVSEHRTDWNNARLFLAETGTQASDDWKRVPAWAFRLLTLDVSYHQLHSYWGEHTERQMLEFLRDGNVDFTWNPARHFALGLSVVLAAGALVAWVVGAARGGKGAPARPFLLAAVGGVVANTALLGLTHKSAQGHYVQSLLPFYFVAFAELGRMATGWRRARWAVLGAAALVCVGGVDSARWVSGELDARNGLGTMRRVFAAIKADRPEYSSVTLTITYRPWIANYVAVADLSMGVLSLRGGPQYRLTLHYEPAPAGAKLVARLGPVTLYTWPTPGK
jgi:hypothetical protein